MFLYETHRFKDRLVAPHRRCPFMPGFLKAMREGGEFTAEQRRMVKSWVVKPGRADPRLKDPAIKEGFEMGIAWEAVHRQMQYRAVREARERGQMLLYVQAVDLPEHRRTNSADYKAMLQVPNVNNTGHLMGMCPLYTGMRVRLNVKLSAKNQIVQDAVGEVVGVQFHPREFEAPGSDWRVNKGHEAHGLGYYRCNRLPRCVFVKFDGFKEKFGFGEGTDGVVQVAPHRATWIWKDYYRDDSGERKQQNVKVTRYQFPLLPEKVRTVQTAQGMGMDAATMVLQKTPNMSHDDWWPHLYWRRR